MLVTDGITERLVEGGGRFGVDGLRRAIQGADAPTAAATAMAIQHAVTSCGATRSRTTPRSSCSRSTERSVQDPARSGRLCATCSGSCVQDGVMASRSVRPLPRPLRALAGDPRPGLPGRASGRGARRLPGRQRHVPVLRRVGRRPARRGRPALPAGAGHRPRRLGLRGRPGLARGPGLRSRRRLPARVRHRRLQAGPARRRRRHRGRRRRLAAGRRRLEPHRPLRRDGNLVDSWGRTGSGVGQFRFGAGGGNAAAAAAAWPSRATSSTSPTPATTASSASPSTAATAP